MPARTICSMISSVSEDGPSVQTIFAFRISVGAILGRLDLADRANYEASTFFCSTKGRMRPEEQLQNPIQNVGAEPVREQDRIHLVLSYIGLLALIPLLTVNDSRFVRWHAIH